MGFTMMISLQYYHCLPTSINLSLQLFFEVIIPSIYAWGAETGRPEEQMLNPELSSIA